MMKWKMNIAIAITNLITIAIIDTFPSSSPFCNHWRESSSRFHTVEPEKMYILFLSFIVILYLFSHYHYYHYYFLIKQLISDAILHDIIVSFSVTSSMYVYVCICININIHTKYTHTYIEIYIRIHI